MKLTLRYLLAYLDDVLKPSDAARIGKLIKSNRNARNLVERIRTIIRMRRLQAPKPDDRTPEIDANDVAEYLDHLTPVADVVSYEKGLLGSDERLAEVAATHQILSLVLGSNPTIPESTKPQMYKTIATLLPEETNWPQEDDSSGSSVDIPAMVAPVMGASAPEIAIPFELPRRYDTGKQFLALLGILLLVGVWVYSIVTDPTFRDQQQNQILVENDPTEASTPVDDENLVAQADASADASTTDSPVESQAPAQSNEETTPAKNMSVTANEVAKLADATTSSPPKATIPQPTPSTTAPPALVSNSQTPTKMNTSEPDNPQAVEPPVPAVPEAKFLPRIINATDENPLILVRPEAESANAVLAENSAEFQLADELYVPPYSQVSLSVENSALRIHLLEYSTLRLLGAVNDQSLGLEIAGGRIVIESLPETAETPIQFLEMMLNGNRWQVEFPKTNTRLAIEILQLPAHGYEQIPAEGLMQAHCWVAGAPVRVQSSDGAWSEPVNSFRFLPKLIAPTVLPKDEPAAEPVIVEQAPAESLSDLSIPPGWMEAGPLEMTLAQRRDQQEFNKRLQGSTNLWLDMQGVANDPNARIAELATRVLAMGQQIDTLVALLARSPHEESRTAAIRGLREWLPRELANRDQLRQYLQSTFRAETAETVYRMLWGYSRQDGQRPDISRQLVDNLRHDHVAVRELAIFWIYELTGQRLGYRPLAVASTREQAVTSWERHLNRVGALIEPEN